MQNQKIISLVPSITLLLCDLGLEKSIVGRTKFCIHPKDKIKTIPTIGGTKNIDIQKIKALQPNIIFATKEENEKQDIQQLKQDFNVIIFDIKNLEDNYKMIAKIGKLTNTETKANEIIEQTKLNFGKLERHMQCVSQNQQEINKSIKSERHMQCVSQNQQEINKSKNTERHMQCVTQNQQEINKAKKTERHMQCVSQNQQENNKSKNTERHMQCVPQNQQEINKSKNTERHMQCVSTETENNVKSISTLYLIWRKPYMTIGKDTFIHSMLETIGLKNMFGHQTRYPIIQNLQTSYFAKCQLILLSSEPYPFANHHIKEIQEQLPNAKILLVDGEFFSWYGSKMIDAPVYFQNLLENINES